MKTSPVSPGSRSPRLAFALGAACCAGLFALPESVPALSGTGSGGSSECVRFEAGREVTSGDCVWVIGITEEWDVGFEDEAGKRSGMSYRCEPSRSGLSDADASRLPQCKALVYPLSGAGERHCAETDVMPGERCALSLDDEPAMIPENPPRPDPAWFCLRKTGADEAMCLKRPER